MTSLRCLYVVAGLLFALDVDHVNAVTFNVIPSVDSASSDDSSSNPGIYSVSAAIDMARGGDTIVLGHLHK